MKRKIKKEKERTKKRKMYKRRGTRKRK